MDKQELLECYEAPGEESDFQAAKPLRSARWRPRGRAGAERLQVPAMRTPGVSLRRAVELYEQAIELSPGDDNPHYQLIVARAPRWRGRSSRWRSTSGGWRPRQASRESVARAGHATTAARVVNIPRLDYVPGAHSE
jgi:hypothetical protein